MKAFFSTILYTLFGLIVIGLTVLFVAPATPLLSGFDVKIVKSGSMEPQIMTGAVVVIKESVQYGVGDIITFNNTDTEIPTTHRIVGTESVDGVSYFVTKGDANEERDMSLVAVGDVIGKVMVNAPYAGYVLDFARQPLGFVLLVGIPALLIVLDELVNIWQEVKRMRRPKVARKVTTPLEVAPYSPRGLDKTRPAKLMDITPIVRNELGAREEVKAATQPRMYHDIRPKMSALVTSVLVFALVTGFTSLEDISTLSYPMDIEASLDNSMQAKRVDFSVSPTTSEIDFSIEKVTNIEVIVTPDGVSATELVYDVAVEKVSGDSAFCDDVLVDAESPLIYADQFKNLADSGVSFIGSWPLNFSMAGVHNSGETCSFNLVFNGYLAGTDGMTGYIDTEIVSLNFIAETALPLVPSSSPQATFTALLPVGTSTPQPGAMSEEVSGTSSTAKEASSTEEIIDSEITGEGEGREENNDNDQGIVVEEKVQEPPVEDIEEVKDNTGQEAKEEENTPEDEEVVREEAQDTENEAVEVPQKETASVVDDETRAGVGL
ncbi:MAG: signal peptidase I [Candidatus Nomurabacteria bacterium]|nr:MAG: signal peptidase I [Candidatus Nomurabacteria bacterium]